MKIEFTAVRELRSYPNNARTHSRKQIRQIANSIEKFRFCNPVLIDDSKQIIAGHGRVEAAKLLGIDAVPTCRRPERSRRSSLTIAPVQRANLGNASASRVTLPILPITSQSTGMSAVWAVSTTASLQWAPARWMKPSSSRFCNRSPIATDHGRRAIART
jgi:ParB-like nuclease domain